MASVDPLSVFGSGSVIVLGLFPLSAISSSGSAIVAGVGFGVGSGFLGLLGPAMGFGGVGGFWGGSGSSSSIGVTAPFRMIPSSISSLGISMGVRGVVLIRVVITLSGAFLSSQATSGASTVFPLSGPSV